MPSDIILTAQVDAPGEPLTHYWSMVMGAGRANEGLRADWQQHLAMVRRDCGCRYVRFHGLFHDDMFIYSEAEDGTPTYNFQYVDALFDTLLDAGVKPFVELGFSPRPLARETNTVFWWGAHGSPPIDLGRWSELITRTLTHWVDRYGATEVTSWYFEVWNEPNLDGFFRGTRSEYYAVYETTALALKAVDKRLRVGGPATSNYVPDVRFDAETEDYEAHLTLLDSQDINALDWRPVWVEHFLAWCAERGLPVDFVSTHPYPTDWALDEHGRGAKLTRSKDATPIDLKRIRAVVAASAYPRAEIHLTEWSSSSSPRDFAHDTLPPAAFIVRSYLHGLNQVDSLAYWTFTDVFEESGAGDEVFHGGFGMITLQSIPKPAFHAFRMLHALGDEVVAQTDGAIVTRQRESGRAVAVAYHYPDEVASAVPASFDSRESALEVEATGAPASLDLIIDGLAPGAGFMLEILDHDHGNALAAWRDLGQPADSTRRLDEVLRQAGWATKRVWTCADASGRLRVTRELAPWSVVLVEQVTPSEVGRGKR